MPAADVLERLWQLAQGSTDSKHANQASKVLYKPLAMQLHISAITELGASNYFNHAKPQSPNAANNLHMLISEAVAASASSAGSKYANKASKVLYKPFAMQLYVSAITINGASNYFNQQNLKNTEHPTQSRPFNDYALSYI